MSVVFRKVENSLKRVMRRPGGVTVAAALAQAEANLQTLEPPMTEELDLGLARLKGLVGKKIADRPTVDTLREICAVADNLISLCAVVRYPGLAESLNRLCLMADALSASSYWTVGALDPALDLALLSRQTQLDPAVLPPLIAGLDRCVEQYLKFEGGGDGTAAVA